MKSRISPLAPDSLPADLPIIDGVQFAVGQAGIRGKPRIDVLMMSFDSATTVAGVFTKSLCRSATVDWCRQNLVHGTARALVVNSGNANAFTGQHGWNTVVSTSHIAAAALKCQPQEVFIASTGVIGEPLDAKKFEGVLDGMAKIMAPDCWMDASKAIMTTDTYPKLATRSTEIDGHTVTINGITKGSGMIAPDMATTLGFIFTDAPIDPTSLQALLTEGAATTFNAITVDGDTSTNDMILLFATGSAKKRGVPHISCPKDPRLTSFKSALFDILRDLALQIVRDGEGATKLIQISVTGATDHASARSIALSIANSPLVKTAIAGEDANWGRIVMAVGKAGQPADRDLLEIWFGSYRVAYKGQRDATYNEEKVSTYMQSQQIDVSVNLNLKEGQSTVWTCDLSHGYIDINGRYRS